MATALQASIGQRMLRPNMNSKPSLIFFFTDNSTLSLGLDQVQLIERSDPSDHRLIEGFDPDR